MLSFPEFPHRFKILDLDQHQLSLVLIITAPTAITARTSIQSRRQQEPLGPLPCPIPDAHCFANAVKHPSNEPDPHNFWPKVNTLLDEMRGDVLKCWTAIGEMR